MEKEITKSKISQELYDQGFANEELEIDSDIFYRASTAIDELSQRLIDQTASGMERGKKDQEEIKRLNRELEVCKEVIEDLMEYVEQPPDSNCSCHLVAPCADCTDHSGIRDILQTVNYLMAKPYPQKEGA